MQLRIDVTVTRDLVAGETYGAGPWGPQTLTQSWINANPPGTFTKTIKAEKIITVPDSTSDTQLQAFADAAVAADIAQLPPTP